MIKLLILLLGLVACGGKKSGEPTAPQIPTERPTEEPPPLSTPRPGHINFDWVEQFMQRDAENLTPDERNQARYLVATHLYNQGIGEFNPDRIEQAINRGLNGLSGENPFPGRAVPIDENRTIYRFFREDFSMSQEEWIGLGNRVIYDVIPDTIRNQTLQFLVGAIKPWLFADDIMTTAYCADTETEQDCMYYDLTEQPVNNVDFFRFNIGIDVQDQYNRQRVALAGGDDSSIAQATDRIVEIIDTPNRGFLQTTYDVSQAQQDAVILNPFTKEAAQAGGTFRSDKIFNHLANEFIFELPNGAPGWRLSNAAGIAEVTAPQDIVSDIEQRDIDGAIRIGACSNCHGIDLSINFTDDVANNCLNIGSFDALEKQTCEVFFNRTRFEGFQSAINQRYRAFNKTIGVDSDQQDPLVNVLIRPMRGELVAAKVCARTFLTEDECLQRLQGTTDSIASLGSLLSGQTVTLRSSRIGFQDLIRELNIFRDRGQL